MSLQESIAPTKERFNKGDHIEAPEYSPTKRRLAHRADHKFEYLFKAGRINEGCMQAGMKLVRHYEGSMGSDIRITAHDWLRVDCDNDQEDDGLTSRARHAKKLAQAETYMLSRPVCTSKRMWFGLMDLVKETRSLEDIGQEWMGCKSRSQAYIAGLALISMALEELSMKWGFSQAYHQHPPSR